MAVGTMSLERFRSEWEEIEKEYQQLQVWMLANYFSDCESIIYTNRVEDKLEMGIVKPLVLSVLVMKASSIANMVVTAHLFH